MRRKCVGLSPIALLCSENDGLKVVRKWPESRFGNYSFAFWISIALPPRAAYDSFAFWISTALSSRFGDYSFAFWISIALPPRAADDSFAFWISTALPPRLLVQRRRTPPARRRRQFLLLLILYKFLVSECMFVAVFWLAWVGPHSGLLGTLCFFAFYAPPQIAPPMCCPSGLGIA